MPRRRKIKEQYDDLFVQDRINKIRHLIERGNADIPEIGRHLLDIKAELPYGKFSVWIKHEFDWSPRTALNYMRVAERFKGNRFATVANLPTAFIYMLADPRTPEELVWRVLECEDPEDVDLSKYKSEIKAIWNEVGERKRKQRHEKRQAKEQAEAELEAAENEEFDDDDDFEDEDFGGDEAGWRNGDEYKKIDRKAEEALNMIGALVPDCEQLLADTLVALRVSSICRQRLRAGTISVLDD